MIAYGLENIKKKWPDIEKQNYPLYAFFLYTSADTNINSFVDKYWAEIQFLSGTYCLVFILHGENEDFKHIMTIQAPMEESYIIAKKFNIDFNKLPGLLFFEDVYSDRFVFFSLKHINSAEGFINEMRSLFNLIQATPAIDVLNKFTVERRLKLMIMNIKEPIRDILVKILNKYFS